MRIRQIAKIMGGQDGAIWGSLLFRFGNRGQCSVYDLSVIGTADWDGSEAEAIASFTLDKADVLVPHSNAVMFGTEYYSTEDEFPLLYSNIYNNYAKTEAKCKGVCCVYRLQREGTSFTTKMVQLIEIGFVENTELWASGPDADVRPYGNFAIDREHGIYYGFVMRDTVHETRYFSFRLPRLSEGEPDRTTGVRKTVLQPADILEQFDCPYHHYVQGACTHGGKIYSLEGFTNDEKNPPALRIIDPQAGVQLCCEQFVDYGLTIEPELIDFMGDVCWYADHTGNLYMIEF